MPDRRVNGKVMTPGSRWAAWLQAAGPELAIEHLVSEIASGKPFFTYCNENLIPYTTVRDWVAADEDRAARYARAREDRADVLADQIQTISDEVEVEATYQGQEVTLGLSSAAVARNKLRVDARKWLASKMKPRVYGDKLELGGSLQLTMAEQLKAINDQKVPPHAAMPPGADV